MNPKLKAILLKAEKRREGQIVAPHLIKDVQDKPERTYTRKKESK